MPTRSSEPLGKALSITMIASRTDLRAAGHRIPRAIRPFDRCRVCHNISLRTKQEHTIIHSTAEGFNFAVLSHHYRDNELDMRPYISYIGQIPLSREGRPPEVSRRWSGCGARGRICSSLSGGLGIMSPGITTGVGGASLDWDRRRRVTPVQTASQEAWPEAEPLGWNNSLR